MKLAVFRNKAVRTIGLIVLVFVVCYVITTVYYMYRDSGTLYLYSEKSDTDPILYDSRRKLLIKNLSFIDRLFVIGYHGGYVDGFEYKDTWMKHEDYNESDDLAFLNKIIENQGTCTLGGKEVSMYAYYYTYTFFGIPYNEYVITCKQVEIKSTIDYLLQRKSVRPLSN